MSISTSTDHDATLRPVKVCSVPGCPTLVTAGARCSTHALPTRGRPHRRASSHLDTATTCVLCGERFTKENPMRRGHVTAISDGGTHVSSNYQPECRRCSDAGANERARTTVDARTITPRGAPTTHEGRRTPRAVSRGVYGFGVGRTS